MESKKYTLEQEQIARFAKAMGHPARMAILEFLAKQDCCFFGDIHEELPIAKATVSQHLKELKEAGYNPSLLMIDRLNVNVSNNEGKEAVSKVFGIDFETNKTAEMSKEMVKPAEITMNI